MERVVDPRDIDEHNGEAGAITSKTTTTNKMIDYPAADKIRATTLPTIFESFRAKTTKISESIKVISLTDIHRLDDTNGPRTTSRRMKLFRAISPDDRRFVKLSFSFLFFSSNRTSKVEGKELPRNSRMSEERQGKTSPGGTRKIDRLRF